MPPEKTKLRELQAYELGRKCGAKGEAKSKYLPLIGRDKNLERWFTIGLIDGMTETKRGNK